MEKSDIIPQNQITLQDIWDNLFNRISEIVVGDTTKAGYFLMPDYTVEVGSSDTKRWLFMFTQELNNILGPYSKNKKNAERENNTGQLLKGAFTLDSEKNRKKDGSLNAFKNCNLRYKKLLAHIVAHTAGTMEQEKTYLEQLFLQSAALVTYLHEKKPVSEYKVKQDIISDYRNRIDVRKIHDEIESYTANYYPRLETVDAFELLTVVILLTLTDISAFMAEEADGRPSEKVANAAELEKLQQQTRACIFDYLSDDNRGGQGKDLFSTWIDKIDKTIEIADQYTIHNTNIRYSLEQAKMLKTIRLTRAITLDDKQEIKNVMAELRSELSKIRELQEKLRQLGSNMKGLNYNTNEQILKVFEDAMEETTIKTLNLEKPKPHNDNNWEDK